VRIIVDANIVFSGILNSNGKIGDLLINSKKHFDFIAPDFLRIEINKHHSRLRKISGLTIEEIKEAEFQICKDITFISEEQIKKSAWNAATKLVADIDPKDTHYVAFSKHFRCKIWSGDKALMKGLAKKKFTNFISTEELYKLRQHDQ
jgi:predicted nucleic acid-binding protein